MGPKRTRATTAGPAAKRKKTKKDVTEPDDAITRMRIKDLKVYAELHDISLRGITKISEIKAAVRGHFAPDAPPPAPGEDDEDVDTEVEPVVDPDIDPDVESDVDPHVDIGEEEEERPHALMGRAKLMDIAKTRGVDIDHSWNRLQIVAAINAHGAAQGSVESHSGGNSEIEEPPIEEEGSLRIESPIDYGTAATDEDARPSEEIEEGGKAKSNFAKREEAVKERERQVFKREEDYLMSREQAIEEREQAIKEKEDEFAGKKRTLSEADPDHALNDPRPQRRQRLEVEVSEELAKDLPRPPVPEILEREEAKMKLQRDGEDFKTRGKDVKQWYEAGMVLDSETDNERWICKKGVGEGAYGSCSLWVRATDKLITDRVVLKDQIINEHSLNALTWTFNGFREKPMEAELQLRLWERNPRCFLGYRGFSYDKSDHTFKLYTEYARYGNLRGLMDKFASNSKSSFPRKECIPEPFIWYVARELVLAAKTMATGFRSKGSTTSNKDAEDKWVEIIHMDIKPQNILMTDHDPEPEDENVRIFNWPKIQVTDFGVAVELHSQWQNPQDLTGRGTSGYKAPEQYRQVGRNPDEYPIQQLSAKTNVWGIGAVLYDLMNPRTTKGKDKGGPIPEENSEVQGSRIGYHKDLVNFDVERNLPWRQIADDGGKHTNRSRPEDVKLNNAYSNPLVELVTKCLAFRPEDRMDLERMERTIDGNLENWYHRDPSVNVDWTGLDNLDFETKLLKVEPKKTPVADKFAIGSLREDGGATEEK